MGRWLWDGKGSMKYFLEIEGGMIYHHTGGDKNGSFKNSNYIRKQHGKKA